VYVTQFCQLTRDGEVYHDYCLNYSKAVNYLEQLRKNDEFCDFEKVRDTTLLAISSVFSHGYRRGPVHVSTVSRPCLVIMGHGVLTDPKSFFGGGRGAEARLGNKPADAITYFIK